jgi:protein-disulfide isomerase
MRRLSPVLLFAAAALALTGCERPQSEAAFGERVRAYLLEHPEVLEEAINKLQAQRTAEAAATAKTMLASNTKALLADSRDPVIGDPRAPITVVEFFDYRCGYCKASAPEVLALTEQNRDVRLVMKEMPILSPESEYAARVALVAAKAGKYKPVHRALMAERAVDKANVDRIARANGVDPSGANDPAITSHIEAVHALAGALQINGTPAFVVGDQIVAGADMAALQAAIDAQRKRG